MIALETDSGPILAPFWLPKSDQIGPKRAPKSIKKVIEKLVEFGIDFETIFGHFLAKMKLPFRGGQISKIWKIRTLGSKCFSITFLIDFGTLLGPIWSVFGIQNGAKIGPESVPRAIMKQMQISSNSSAGAVFLRIGGAWNRSKIALKTMLS